MSKNLWEDETPGRENIKFVWKYYLIAFVGLGLVWLSQKVQAQMSIIELLATKHLKLVPKSSLILIKLPKVYGEMQLNRL